MKIYDYLDQNDKQEEPAVILTQEQLITQIDSNQQKKLLVLSEMNAFNKMDSVIEWINSHVDSIYTGNTDTNNQIDYLYNQLSPERIQYSIDCLEYKISFLDSHPQILEIKKYDSVQKIRDSLSQNLINYYQSKKSVAETSSKILSYILKLLYLPIILIFPGRWLFNYIRNRN
ncbi:MAG TPA: hypothetical protein VLZ75_14545 [Chitinophagales bacterium]|nr:hypothetical protein [Chitinophagales bacterium]